MAYKFSLGTAILSGALTPGADDAFDLGASGKEWKDLYLDGTATVDALVSSGVVTATGIVSGAVDFKVGDALELGPAGEYGIQRDGQLDIASMGTNWTNSGRTIADLGTVSAATSITSTDLIGTNIDGIIGADTARAGTFTTATVDALTATADLDIGPFGFTAKTLVADIADGTAPMTITSTTKVANLNVDKLDGADWAAPAALGSTTPAAVSATTLSGSSTLIVDGNATLNANLDVGGTVVNMPNVAAASLDAADLIMSLDATTKDVQLRTRTNVVSDMAGDGLAAASGVLAVGVDDSSIEIDSDALRVKAAGITDAMLNDDVATGLAGDGLGAASGVMKLDINELTAAAVDVSADSIAIVDANDSNLSRKESIADLVTAMAGAGLTATNGVLSSDASPTPTDHGNDNGTLVEGLNWSSADFTASRTWTLPASPDAGDVVSVKAPLLAGNSLTVAKAGSQTIDGDLSVIIDSDNGAVDFVYVGSDKWIIK